jgi:hypothetical protein
MLSGGGARCAMDAEPEQKRDLQVKAGKIIGKEKTWAEVRRISGRDARSFFWGGR